MIPDGILTNASLQYVRAQIEEDFRLVALVSMPQTAFSANGAGVKSSVMILRKYTEDKSEELRLLKESLQEDTKEECDFLNKYNKILKDKNVEIKSYSGDKLSDDFKDWKKVINEKYSALIENLKENTNDRFDSKWREVIAEKYDYPVFMAIAEDIGYDAVGKETGKNELEHISVALQRFISDLESEGC